MKENQLRIGNFIDEHNDEFLIITGINEGDVYFISSQIINPGIALPVKNKIERIKPIPLTEEWLLKFGFIEDEDGWHHDGSGYHFGLRKIYGEFVYFHSNGTPCSQDINQVHKLQNLFFAINGEELTINKQH